MIPRIRRELEKQSRLVLVGVEALAWVTPRAPCKFNGGHRGLPIQIHFDVLTQKLEWVVEVLRSLLLVQILSVSVCASMRYLTTVSTSTT